MKTDKKPYTQTTRGSEGFTLIELLLVLAFMGSLLLLISASTIQAISIYNKGSAIKQINQAGRSLIEDINRLSGSGAEIDIEDNGIAGCLRVGFTGGGGRVFLWNSVERGTGGVAPLAGDQKWMMNSTEISLVQSTQSADTAAYCYLPNGPSPEILDADEMSPVLTRQVRILSVDIAKPSGTGTSLKKIAFWIGTSDNSASGSDDVPGMRPTFDSATNTWTCKGGTLGAFCSVSRFETVIYTPNTGGAE